MRLVTLSSTWPVKPSGDAGLVAARDLAVGLDDAVVVGDRLDVDLAALEDVVLDLDLETAAVEAHAPRLGLALAVLALGL